MNKNYITYLQNYLNYLKKEKIFNNKNLISYEINVEKLQNWSIVDFKDHLNWYIKVKKKNKSKISFKHLEFMDKWVYHKKKGVLSHESKGFFSIVGISTKGSNREVKNWDQPFVMQKGYKGGIIGLVRTYIKGVPHYLVDAKYEPGNFNNIQLSPSIQATFSNLNQIHKGARNQIREIYFKKNFKTIKKIWVTEDGGRLFKKRNLHWIINCKYKKINLPYHYRWLTLWDINQFNKSGSYVGPHLRSILALITC